jgi:hypothetical protein
MIYAEVPKKQKVRLVFDKNTETYPSLYFSEDGVDVLKVMFHPEIAEECRRLLAEAHAKLVAEGKVKA